MANDIEMEITLQASRLGGTAAVPPSKSAAHRAVLCAGLAQGQSRIAGVQRSEDILATLDAVRMLGARADLEQDGTLTVEGCGGRFATVTGPVNCRESGSTLRFLIPLFSLTGQKVRFTGAPRLFQRPQQVYAAVFAAQEVGFLAEETGLTVQGALQSGSFSLPGDVSSQFISGLLFAAPLMESDSEIQVQAPFESKSYVGMTLDALHRAGIAVQAEERPGLGGAEYRVPGGQRYQPISGRVEGDYSQAAFLAVLGLLPGCAPQGITVTGLSEQSRQGDRVILEILRRCGAKIALSDTALHTSRSILHGTGIDLADCPDLGPVLMTLGCFCDGVTVITNARRLRYKESDRIAAMEQELRKLGAKIESDENTVTITGGVALHAPETALSAHNDHRVAMALAVAVLGAGVPARMTGAQAVAKSWPEFFAVLEGLGAKISQNPESFSPQPNTAKTQLSAEQGGPAQPEQAGHKEPSKGGPRA